MQRVGHVIMLILIASVLVLGRGAPATMIVSLLAR